MSPCNDIADGDKGEEVAEIRGHPHFFLKLLSACAETLQKYYPI